jgi:cell division cycle 20-like protein 1 (cofactor of APC complex)
MGASEEAYNLMITKASITKAANALNTPPVATPPRTSTPPLGAAERRKSDKRAHEGTGARGERASGTPVADAIDPNALSKALLKEFEEGGRPRETTPGGSPSRKRQRVYGDR